MFQFKSWFPSPAFAARSKATARRRLRQAGFRAPDPRSQLYGQGLVVRTHKFRWATLPWWPIPPPKSALSAPQLHVGRSNIASQGTESS